MERLGERQLKRFGARQHFRVERGHVENDAADLGKHRFGIAAHDPAELVAVSVVRTFGTDRGLD